MFTIIGIPCSSFSRKLNISTDLRLVILVMKHFCSYCFSAVFKCFIIDTIIIIIIIILFRGGTRLDCKNYPAMGGGGTVVTQ